MTRKESGKVKPSLVEPIESRLQISLVELLVLRLCHKRVTFSGLFEQLMELLIGGESAFADVWKVS